MIVISSKKSAEESKARARARDEQLIDLEWQMNLLSQELGNVKEENQVLTGDCHKLLAKIEKGNKHTAEETSKVLEAQALADKLQKDNEKL